MYCYYVCIGMKWLSLFILPEVHYATVDMITSRVIVAEPNPSPLWPLRVYYSGVCAHVRCQANLKSRRSSYAI